MGRSFNFRVQNQPSAVDMTVGTVEVRVVVTEEDMQMTTHTIWNAAHVEEPAAEMLGTQSRETQNGVFHCTVERLGGELPEVICVYSLKSATIQALRNLWLESENIILGHPYGERILCRVRDILTDLEDANAVDDGTVLGDGARMPVMFEDTGTILIYHDLFPIISHINHLDTASISA